MVQPGQVEAGAEDPRSRVAGVLDDAAAQNADLDLGIEQDQVDGALARGDGGVVLGVQVARVAKLEHSRATLPADVNRAEVGDPGGAKVIEPLERLARGAEHRPDEVGAGPGRGEDVREEDSLSDLGALLVGQLALGLGRHLGGARHQAGEALGGRDQQLLVAKRPSTSRR